jgi:hypothetical protein
MPKILDICKVQAALALPLPSYPATTRRGALCRGTSRLSPTTGTPLHPIVQENQILVN